MSGESKQIDEDENGPENGGMKSGPCLIAGFHALSCTSPSYYNPYRGVNKNTLSVDMVRLSITFKGDRGEWLSRKGAQLTDCDEMSAWTHQPAKGTRVPAHAVREAAGWSCRPAAGGSEKLVRRGSRVNVAMRDYGAAWSALAQI